MRLHVSCENCGQRMNININSSTRNNLRYHFGGDEFYATCRNCGHRGIYNVSRVRATADSNTTPGGAIAGGLLGLIGGPLGMVIGGVLGAAIGNANDLEDNRKTDLFNNSH